MQPAPTTRHPRRARARHLRRLGHHRPHLAGRLDQADLAGRHLPAGERRRGRRLQQLRLAPRQPRGDDARHVRQRAHQEPDAAAARRRLARGRRRHAVPAVAARRCRSTTRRCTTSRQGTPTVVFGGEEYGTGSSRDWAAKGTQLLGVKAVVAKSFERIHRSNLVGMGVLPLQFKGSRQRRVARHHAATRPSTSSCRATSSPQQDLTLRDHAQGRLDAPTCRCCCGSTRRSRSTTTGMAASCRSCCAS